MVNFWRFNENFKCFKLKIFSWGRLDEKSRFSIFKHAKIAGSDASKNRKFETGKVALLGSKNFQHLMFIMKNAAFSENISWGRLDEKSRFSNRENGRGWLFLKIVNFFHGSDAAENRKFET